MTYSIEEKNLIVKQTYDLIMSKNFNEDLRHSAAKDGFYGKLCEKLNKPYKYSEAMKYKKLYERNNWHYKELVEEFLKNNGDKDKFIENRVEYLNFTNLEWDKFLHIPYLSKKTTQQSFLTPFHDHIANLLQEKGIHLKLSNSNLK